MIELSHRDSWAGSKAAVTCTVPILSREMLDRVPAEQVLPQFPCCTVKTGCGAGESAHALISSEIAFGNLPVGLQHPELPGWDLLCPGALLLRKRRDIHGRPGGFVTVSLFIHAEAVWHLQLASHRVCLCTSVFLPSLMICIWSHKLWLGISPLPLPAPF